MPSLQKYDSEIWKLSQRSKILRYLLSLFFARYAIFSKIIAMPRVLDVGCGRGDIMSEYRRMGLQSYVVGVDLHLPSLRESLAKRSYDDVILASALNLPFREQIFGATLLFQVIEHLSEDNGLFLINECERVGSKVILTTPVGFVPQEEYDNNQYQLHLSGWTPKNMAKQRFKVRGYAGLSICWAIKRGGGAMLKGQFGLYCSLFIALLTQPLVYLVPDLGFQMLCIRQLHVNTL